MVKYPAMPLLPNNKQEWLNTVLFPLKAYTVIAPTLFEISVRLPRPRHSGATDIPLVPLPLLAGLIFPHHPKIHFPPIGS